MDSFISLFHTKFNINTTRGDVKHCAKKCVIWWFDWYGSLCRGSAIAEVPHDVLCQLKSLSTAVQDGRCYFPWNFTENSQMLCYAPWIFTENSKAFGFFSM